MKIRKYFPTPGAMVDQNKRMIAYFRKANLHPDVREKLKDRDRTMMKKYGRLHR